MAVCSTGQSAETPDRPAGFVRGVLTLKNGQRILGYIRWNAALKEYLIVPIEFAKRIPEGDVQKFETKPSKAAEED